MQLCKPAQLSAPIVTFFKRRLTIIVRRRSVVGTKRQATNCQAVKCLRDEMSSDEVLSRRDVRRQSVTATIRQATKRRRQNGGVRMSLNTRDEGDDFSRTIFVSFSCAAANCLKSMLPFGSTCNAFACK